MRVQKAGLQGVNCLSHDFLPSGWIAGYLIQCYVYMSVHTIAVALLKCVAGCTLPTMYGGSFDASYYGKSKGWAHLIQGKRQFEECTPAQKAKSRTWARQSQDKDRKRGPRVLPKRGGPDRIRLSCFFSVILAFSWLPWELKLARLPDCQARGD